MLLCRIAEIPHPKSNRMQAPVLDEKGNIKILSFANNAPALKSEDPRLFSYQGNSYLTTISHLRLAWSSDRIHFTIAEDPILTGKGEYETYGIEDCRVVQIDETYYLTYSAVSEKGVGVGMISTTNWKTFNRCGLIFSPPNKDCAIFPEKSGQYFYALHRPSKTGFGGNDIWLARSPDLEHWGHHRCIARTRPGMWDSVRIGAGGSPIKTSDGWLAIYHGANEKNRYCLGVLLLDTDYPEKVLARSEVPIMEPITPYEIEGFFGGVVFTNGHTVHNDIITIYYGASDEFVCGAEFSIKEILASL
jgi:predicted GH43/DUF377 family glycosyl hydrolase